MKDKIKVIGEVGDICIISTEICAYEIDHRQDVLFIYLKSGKYFKIPSGKIYLGELIDLFNLNNKL